MKGFAVAKRYSAALWGLAKDVETAELWSKSLESVSAMMVESQPLKKLLTSPLVSFEKKWAVLSELLDRTQSPKQVNLFLRRVLQAKRIAALDLISEAFRQKLLLDKGIVEVLVESAVPLLAPQNQELVARFEKMTGKKVVIINKHAPELLAGIRASFGSKTYDGSLKTYLANLEKHLLKEDFVTHATA